MFKSGVSLSVPGMRVKLCEMSALIDNRKKMIAYPKSKFDCHCDSV